MGGVYTTNTNERKTRNTKTRTQTDRKERMSLMTLFAGPTTMHPTHLDRSLHDLISRRHRVAVDVAVDLWLDELVVAREWTSSNMRQVRPRGGCARSDARGHSCEARGWSSEY